MATSGRVFEFDVAVDRNGTATSSPGGMPIPKDDAWWAEHLVLAGLVRCTLASLRHEAQRGRLDVVAEGRAHGTVTRRDEDGRYAFVEIESTLEVELSPAPQPAELAELIQRTERGCFVGNSLIATPQYRWKVNGEELS